MHHHVAIRGFGIDFHIYVGGNERGSINELIPYFTRLPDAHLAVLYPIFVMEHKPGGGQGGGTWPPSLVRAQVMGREHAARTHVPDADIERLVVSPGNGMIGIPRDRWERAMGRREFSVMHEVGHCVDFTLGLIPRNAGPGVFEGMMTDRCGAGNAQTRKAVEAYARYICSPDRVYHVVPSGEAPYHANQRLIQQIRSAPAFMGVPATWRPVSR